MTPREHQLVIKKWNENNKYKNRDICEAIRISSWHNSNSKISYNDYCNNYFKLHTDYTTEEQVVHNPPDEQEILDVKDKLKNIMSIKEAK